MNLTAIVLAGILALVGAGAGYFISSAVVSKKTKGLEKKAEEALERVTAEGKERKIQLDRLDDRLIKKEELLDQRASELQRKDNVLSDEAKRLKSSEEEVLAIRQKAVTELEKMAGLSAAEARDRLFKNLEDVHRNELLHTMQKLERDRFEQIEKKASEVITGAIQRYARSHVADVTTTVFHLENEELKGKIIGREGRNIRTLERATGVEFVMDESPENIIISSFDPLRREIARLALEKLIKDGRIQPAKIEEKVEEARQDMDKRMREVGEQATLEVGIVGLPKEIIQLLGRLYFRTSYGQNVLVHSIEMAHISAMIAAELGLNVEVAKKGALLHDIGKALSHEIEGTHVEIGRKLLKKYGIDEAIIRAMESHHEEYPFSTPESFVVGAADIISAGRPGARRDNVENYLKRLEDLEKIATGFEGVKQVYALSAGREIRVFVVPEKMDDFGAFQLAKNIASKIQSDLKYPGEIKVNVIREMRAVEYAR